MRNLTPDADWCRIVNGAADTADVYLYDEIGYWGTSADEFCEQLRGITARRINLHINSPGGEIMDGLAIRSCLRQHDATVVTYVDGIAASSASFIALAGDEVLIDRNAILMIHDATWVCVGNAAEMRDAAELLDKMSDNIADIYAQKAGGLIADWRALMLTETWYTGEEAVTAGLCDQMTPTQSRAEPAGVPENALSRSRFDLAAFADRFRYAGREAAPAPRPINRCQRDRLDPSRAVSMSNLSAHLPSSITVNTTGPAVVNVAWDSGEPVSSTLTGGGSPVNETATTTAPAPADPELEPAAEAAPAPADPDPEPEPAAETTPTPGLTPPAGPGTADDTGPANEPGPVPEPALDATAAPATTPPEPDLWADLTARLTEPESVEDALARLRRAA
jgi:ATP-dependent protease ClpP protease subunit